MDCRELIEHILGNAKGYLDEYSKKDKLDEYEKGILHGLWMDVDSIKNHIDSEIIMGEESAEEALNIKKEINLEQLLRDLEKLFKD